MKKIGFLSFGHWTPSSQSQTRTAGDTLLQSIDLAVAEAIRLARAGRHREAAHTCAAALTQAPPGAAGWLLPAWTSKKQTIADMILNTLVVKV